MNKEITAKTTEELAPAARHHKKCMDATSKLIKDIEKKIEQSRSETIKRRLERIALKLAYLFMTNCIYKDRFVEPKINEYKLLLCPITNIAVPKQYIITTDADSPLDENRGGARKGVGLKKGQRLKSEEERRTETLQIRLTKAEKTALQKIAENLGFSDISSYVRAKVF